MLSVSQVFNSQMLFIFILQMLSKRLIFSRNVLNEIAQDANLGIDIAQKDIPVEEEVYGACEMLGIDLLYVAKEGLFIAVVNETIANKFLLQLKQWEYGSMAGIIGNVTSKHAKQVLVKSNIGGRSVLNMLAGEQLPGIC